MDEPAAAPQRRWRASCPQCGAPVEFRSAAAPLAVCSHCRSTLVREGEALRRIGEVAELFDDHSPLQLGASGQHLGAAFTVVGRLQWQSAEGPWNEWHVLFDTGAAVPRSGWLSEDQGQHLIGFDQPAPAGLPPVARLRPGDGVQAGGQAWSVAAVVAAQIASAEGELPMRLDFGRAQRVVELRNPQGEVASWTVPADAAEGPVAVWSLGRPVRLEDLALRGLKDEASRTLTSQAYSCPQCGAPLSPTLESTRSMVCAQCRAVVDLSQGPGAGLAHFAQAQAGTPPLIPLGTSGLLALGSPKPLAWQVVGYQERCVEPDDPQDDVFHWREYLLYHRREGFAFLVDSEDGWSWVRPISGAPRVLGTERVSWDGVTYRLKDRYRARTTWVLGEFYWPVQREQRSLNADFEGTGAQAARQLNREQAGQELVWSAGATLDAEAVRAAFRLPPAQAARFQRDAGASSGSSFTLSTFFVLLVIVALVFAIARCSRDDCEAVRKTFGAGSAEARQCERSNGLRGGGGSFGGFSTGGSHK